MYINIDIYICIYVFTHIYIYVYIYIYIYLYLCSRLQVFFGDNIAFNTMQNIFQYHMYIFLYIYKYICIYIHLHIYLCSKPQVFFGDNITLNTCNLHAWMHIQHLINLSHMSMSHVTYINEWYHTHKLVIPHMYAFHAWKFVSHTCTHTRIRTRTQTRARAHTPALPSSTLPSPHWTWICIFFHKYQQVMSNVSTRHAANIKIHIAPRDSSGTSSDFELMCVTCLRWCVWSGPINDDEFIIHKNLITLWYKLPSPVSRGIHINELRRTYHISGQTL